MIILCIASRANVLSLAHMAESRGFEPLVLYGHSSLAMRCNKPTMRTFQNGGRCENRTHKAINSTVFKTATVTYRFDLPYGQGSRGRTYDSASPSRVLWPLSYSLIMVGEERFELSKPKQRIYSPPQIATSATRL